MIRPPLRLASILTLLAAAVLLIGPGGAPAGTSGPAAVHLAGLPIGACASCFTDPNVEGPVNEPGPIRP